MMPIFELPRETFLAYLIPAAVESRDVLIDVRLEYLDRCVSSAKPS
jgi:hypothetical protein